MRSAFATMVMALSAPMVLIAHHPLNAFDTSRTVEIRGVVATVEWMNPHPVITLDAIGPDGKAARWRAELQGIPNELVRRGWSSASVKAGDAVVVRGYPERVPPPAGWQPTLTAIEIVVAGAAKLDASSRTRWW